MEEDSTSSTAYEGDISMEGSQGSVEVPESETETETASPEIHITTTNYGIFSKFRIRGGPSPSTLHLSHRGISTEPRLQAELVHARSKISQLEAEVNGLHRVAKRARIMEEGEKDQEYLTLVREIQRLNKAEQQRCKLFEELSSTKGTLVAVEKQLSENTSKLNELTAAYDKDTRTLKDQLNEAQSIATSLRSENGNLKSTLVLLEQRVQLEMSGLGEVQESYERSVESLKTRVLELEKVETQLHHAEAQVQDLEHKLRVYKYDSQFTEAVKSKVLCFDELKRHNCQLTEENKTLKEKSDNVDLLRYKLQSLQERCGRYEGQEARLMQLELENRELRERGEKATTTGSSPALQCRLVDLQHREVVLLSKLGEMETKVKVAEKAAAAASQTRERVRRQLAQEEADSQNKDERIQKLEKRLLFVTKERDGCVNVLNSYRVDAGVDALLKEHLSEMEQHLKRAKERIAELEVDLERRSGHLEEEESIVRAAGCPLGVDWKR